MTKPDTVHLGFEIGSGAPVAVPVQHLAVTGQTQMSGKTTTLEALVARSGRAAVAFVTKRAEGSFIGKANRIAPYFRERADWQFVAAVLEATLREKLKFERSWIMRACHGARSLADVQHNIKRAMLKAKGLSADVYMTLDHYLDIVIPQIDRLPYTDKLDLGSGLNVMDLSDYTTELQSLVIRSVIEFIYQQAHGALVIIPEAWEFVPQSRGSPVLLACEQLIRKGGAAGNFVWIDSQDIAGVHKNILRSVGVWIIGVQREANEVKRALEHMPGVRGRVTVSDVMQLERGQFFACYGATVVKVYVQPAWLPREQAIDIATGRSALPRREDDEMNKAEADALEQQNIQLKARVRVLEAEIAEMRAALRKPALATPHAPPAEKPRHVQPGGIPREANDGRALSMTSADLDTIYNEIKARALRDDDGKLLAVLRRMPEIEVTKTVERIKIDGRTQPGFLAGMIADGFFAGPVEAGDVAVELKRLGRAVHNTNVYRDLNRLAEQGFLTKEATGYRAVPGMLINIVADEAA